MILSNSASSRCEQLAARLTGLVGWRRYSVALVLGAAATLALPPSYLAPVLFIVFPAVLWLLGGAQTKRQAFWTGWWFGFGYFFAGLYWIGFALLVFAAKHAWLLPFAVLGLPGLLAIYSGLAFLIAGRGRGIVARTILLIIAWSALEWVRGVFLTGFPWNLIGQSWVGSTALAQSAALFGVYGLSFLVLASACAPALVIAKSACVRRVALAFAIGVPLLAWIGGEIRLSGAPAPGEGFVDGVGLRIVQASIPQREKWGAEFRNRNLRRHIALSIKDRPDWVTHVIWPEMAATFYVESDPETRRVLSSAAPPGGWLITGAPRRDETGLHNSAIALDSHGAIVGVYDKFHLVPFGEYVPFREFLPFQKLTHGAGGYSPGPGPRTIQFPGLPPVSPLVCYEVIFPGAVMDRRNPADWMLNLTNDGWYGATAGPYQHLAIAQLRAIEEGAPMIRAAYTGVSAIIDPYGRILQRLGLNQVGVIDAVLPEALFPDEYSQRTLYAILGENLFLLMLLTASIILWLSRKLY
ncbi:MAG: apolipoprotein N-acyltransferase [Alphaproteobacteria bacterium]|nr:apolipoprotein N-acyltransferase [Alphaproteobacteria bacterium]